MEKTKKRGLFGGFLNFVERVGNKLPHPVTIFAILALVVIVVSKLCEGLEVTYYNAKESADVTVAVVSLFSKEGLQYIFNNMVKNFTNFAPLGTVLVAMLGVGVAESTGLIDATLKKVVLSTPKSIITYVVVFAGIMSNVASDAGYVVLVPLGALVFLSFGRHPIAGICAAFAGVSAGFSANLILGTLDPLLQGITNEAIKIGGSTVTIEATANWYFMIVSTFLLTILGGLVTDYIVEPRLGKYTKKVNISEMSVSKEESKGLFAALISILLLAAAFLFLTVPENGLLREVMEDGTTSVKGFINHGLVPLIMILFLVPGVVFGIFAGKIKNDKDVVKGMSKAMASMGGYLVLAFAAAQFIAYFTYSNLGVLLAVNGAELLEKAQFTGLPLVVAFIFVAGFINLFIGSASAKWAIMAPIFVPMMMKLGIRPEFTQLAYRIGDSTTNIISPLMAYFAVIVTFAQQYDEDTGIGTLISSMLPYTIVFLIGWTALMIIWYFTGAPIGPDAFMR